MGKRGLAMIVGNAALIRYDVESPLASSFPAGGRRYGSSFAKVTVTIIIDDTFGGNGGCRYRPAPVDMITLHVRCDIRDGDACTPRHMARRSLVCLRRRWGIGRYGIGLHTRYGQ